MTSWAYFSSRSGNTKRLIERIGIEATQIPISVDEEMPKMGKPFALICPSYGDRHGKGAVPQAVIRFLKVPGNRFLLKGIVGIGDRNFGASFTQAAIDLSFDFATPLWHRMEAMGMQSDIAKLREIEAHLLTLHQDSFCS